MDFKIKMTKQDLLQELSIKMRMGEISKEDLSSLLKAELKQSIFKFSVTKMFYFLGAAIVIIGIVIFVAQIWEDLGSFGHILVTLGVGFLLTFLGSIIIKDKQDDMLGSVFHALGGVLIPGGAMVTLMEIASFDPKPIHIAIIFSIISMLYVLLNLIHKTPVLTLFTIANMTATIGAIIMSVNEVAPFTDTQFSYIAIIIGISYLILGQSFRNTWNSILTRPLYFASTFIIFTTTFELIYDSTLWEILYPFLALSGVYLSVYLRSKTILVVSTLALLAFISYVTGEYFADSIGWPLSLVILGFIFIGLGYTSININKKFISA